METFENCMSLCRVCVPDGVTEIGKFAFFGCATLHEIRMPDSIAVLGTGAFGNCHALAAVHLPAADWTCGDRTYSAADLSDPARAAKLLKNSQSNWYRA